MITEIELVRKYIEDQYEVLSNQRDIIRKYDRLCRILASALESETGMAAASFIEWAMIKVDEIDGETA